jgi:hypothetical protein
MKTLSGILAGALFLWAHAAQALVIIKQDNGGIIKDYLNHYEILRASHDPVRLDGPCYSACTIFTAVLPNWQVCYTDKAVLGFHSAFWSIDNSYAELPTMEMFEAYPPKLQKMLKEKGWWGQEHRELVIIKGDELRALGYRKCGETAFTRFSEFLKSIFG